MNLEDLKRKAEKQAKRRKIQQFGTGCRKLPAIVYLGPKGGYWI
jgi:hypothetical protein